MLTIKEICEITGVNINTFHTWRRAEWNLLPAPVGVAKKIIYFDDSIIERIKYIQAQRAAGKNLPEIQDILKQQARNIFASEKFKTSGRDESGNLLACVAELEKKWEVGECKNEVCLALKLDPALSGFPTTFLNRPFVSSDLPLEVYISIISNNHVYFADLRVDLGDNPAEVKKQEKMPVEHYGMFAGQLFQRYADINQFVPSHMIPYLLLEDSFEDVWLPKKELFKIFKEAKKLTKIFKAGQEFARQMNV